MAAANCNTIWIRNSKMTENPASSAPKPAAATANGVDGASAQSSAAAGIPFYEKQRQHLKELITRKRMLDKRLVRSSLCRVRIGMGFGVQGGEIEPWLIEKQQATTEELIAQKEADYLENTPGGNIIVGFDNYTKGPSTAAAQRRKTGLADTYRVFSRSSVSYNAAAAAVCYPPRRPSWSITHSGNRMRKHPPQRLPRTHPRQCRAVLEIRTGHPARLHLRVLPAGGKRGRRTRKVVARRLLGQWRIVKPIRGRLRRLGPASGL